MTTFHNTRHLLPPTTNPLICTQGQGGILATNCIPQGTPRTTPSKCNSTCTNCGQHLQHCSHQVLSSNKQTTTHHCQLHNCGQHSCNTTSFCRHTGHLLPLSLDQQAGHHIPLQSSYQLLSHNCPTVVSTLDVSCAFLQQAGNYIHVPCSQTVNYSHKPWSLILSFLHA